MNSLIAWFAHNKVAANLLMAVLIVAGALSLSITGKELIPAISLDVLLINTGYPGASAPEVERVVTARIEQAINDLPGINGLRSISRGHLSVVSVEINRGFNAQNVKEMVQKRLESINDWPRDVERPEVRQVALEKDLVTNLVLYGRADTQALKALAERVKLQLLDNTEVTQVQIKHSPDYIFDIALSELAMQRYALSFSEVAAAIERQTKDMVSGELAIGGATGSILVVGQQLSVSSLEDMVVRSLPDGGRVLLQDVAKVRTGLEADGTSVAFNGQNAIYLSIYRVGEQDILRISEAVQRFSVMLKESLPDGISVAMWQNMARYYESRVTLLKENAWLGSLILFFVLFCFLNLRLSFWVSLGVPIAFMGAFWVLPMAGGTLNMVSLFAFILVLGIVVDDAIIVGENIYTRQTRGRMPGVKGAIAGAQEVARPVIFAAITTMVMFAPLLFLPSNEGKLVQIIPIVVIAVLGFSLVESLLILPAHLSDAGSGNRLDTIRWLNLNVVSLAFERFTLRAYRPFLAFCLRWRYTVLAFFLMCFILSVGLLSSGWLKFTFFSPIAADTVTLSARFPEGTPSHVVKQSIDAYARVAKDVIQGFESQQSQALLEHTVALYGQTPGKKDATRGAVVLALAPTENRKISGDQIAQAWKEKIGENHLAKKLTFKSTLNQNNAPIEMELLSRDLESLTQAVDALKVELSGFQGVYGIKDNRERQQQDVFLSPRPMASELGIRTAELALQVRQAFHGTTVARISRGEETVPVNLGYAQSMDELWRLENLLITLTDGSAVPLHMLADVRLEKSDYVIHRSQGRRALRVFAQVDPALNHEARIMNDLRADFLATLSAKYPGVSWKSSGIQHSKKRFIHDLLRGFVLAIFVMYGLVATLFRSYFQPFLILFAVPFGLIGAIMGHKLMGFELTLWSVVGITAVSGVVVNDNLVLVDAMNQMRARGLSVLAAVTQAGVERFRPVVLTTLTTFGGLLPMMYETSVQARFMVPMAVSLGYGVLFATAISLFLVPVTYLIGEDIRMLLRLPDSISNEPALARAPARATRSSKPDAKLTRKRAVKTGSS